LPILASSPKKQEDLDLKFETYHTAPHRTAPHHRTGPQPHHRTGRGLFAFSLSSRLFKFTKFTSLPVYQFTGSAWYKSGG
jgi:hypothetical protein